MDFLLYEAINLGFLHTYNALFAVLDGLDIRQHTGSRYCRSTGKYTSYLYAPNKWRRLVRQDNFFVAYFDIGMSVRFTNE